MSPPGAGGGIANLVGASDTLKAFRADEASIESPLESAVNQ